MGSNGALSHDDARRMAATLGKPLPMSASDREKQREAYVLAVDNMARTLRETVKHADGLANLVTQIYAINRKLEDRIDALERDAAVGRAFRSESFMARLRWLVGL